MHVLTLLLVLLPASAEAQIVDPCAAVAPGTTFVVSSTRPARLYWLMDATVPANPPTDMTLVPHRIDGFYVQVNALPQTDTGKLTPTICPAGNSNAGKLALTMTLPAPLAAGSYTLSVKGWNFQLDVKGVPTTTRQNGVALVVPFLVIDPQQEGPPLVPVNLLVSR
jgi:hypothetical protein